MLNVPLSHEKKNPSQITANIPCLPKDPIFIGRLCGSPYTGPGKGKLSNYYADLESAIVQFKTAAYIHGVLLMLV